MIAHEAWSNQASSFAKASEDKSGAATEALSGDIRLAAVADSGGRLAALRLAGGCDFREWFERGESWGAIFLSGN